MKEKTSYNQRFRSRNKNERIFFFVSSILCHYVSFSIVSLLLLLLKNIRRRKKNQLIHFGHFFCVCVNWNVKKIFPFFSFFSELIQWYAPVCDTNYISKTKTKIIKIRENSQENKWPKMKKKLTNKQTKNWIE